VKLADSIDPRRAKTIPRMDRVALARFAEPQDSPESEAPVAISRPDDSLDVPASEASPRWNQAEYEPVSSLEERAGQDPRVAERVFAIKQSRASAWMACRPAGAAGWRVALQSPGVTAGG